MVSKIPFIVEFDHDNDEWVVRIGKDDEIIDQYSSKEEAIDEAAYAAEGDDRPGVVVFTEIGEYSHFVENPQFWSGGYWEHC
ncbi:DUF2188 domain-containing protein [Natrinema sp. HArc-T2]|uniref:DUF2188 domain-containing protein n=1 Tax=Natrinema sp. HArc-T2 TaxID=3242701 RepID=UPI00359E4682